MLPKSRKVVELADAVEEVESCSACYGYLIPALEKLKQEGLLDQLHEKIHIGQGYRNRTGELGIGHCTRKFQCYLEGCPPLEDEVYAFLKDYIMNHQKKKIKIRRATFCSLKEAGSCASFLCKLIAYVYNETADFCIILLISWKKKDKIGCKSETKHKTEKEKYAARGFGKICIFVHVQGKRQGYFAWKRKDDVFGF